MPLKYTAVVDLNGLVLNGPKDSEGVQFTCSGIDGWGPAGTTGGGQQRVGANGGTAPTQWYNSKTLNISGKIFAPNQEKRQIAEHELFGLLELGLFPLTVSEVLNLRAMVRLNGRVGWEVVAGTTTRWQAELYQPDPLRYGTELKSLSPALTLPQTTGGLRFPLRFPIRFTGSSDSGEATLLNAGNRPSLPLIQINGPVTDPILTNVTTGQWIKYTGTLAAGEFLVIDMATQAAALNGTVDYSGNITGDFWALVPGENAVAFRAGGMTAANVLIQWRDAYA